MNIDRMPTTWTQRVKTTLIMFGTAVVTLVLCLTTPAPAPAIPPAPRAPACTGWTYTGNFSIQQDNGLRVDITGWSGTSAGSAHAALFLSDGTPAQINSDGKPVQHGNHFNISEAFTSQQTGSITGGISGNQMDFFVDWGHIQGATGNHYTGTINDNGQGASGLSVNTLNAQNKWNTFATFTCAAQTAPQVPIAQLPVKCTGGPLLPPGSECPGAPAAAQGNSPPASHTVTNDVDLYDLPGGSGKVIGHLNKNDAVTLNGPCPIASQDGTNGWCLVTDVTEKPNLTGAVWGEFISP